MSALVASSVLGGGATAHAQGDKANVQALTTTTAALAPGQSAWIAVVWSADRTVTDWSTTVTAPAGVSVTYPTTRGGADTSLYGSATLVGSTRDFTAFNLSVPYGQRASFPVTVTSTYTHCGDNGQCKNQGQGNDDGPGTTTAVVTVPVQAAVGAPFTQQTMEVAVAAGTSSFQQITFTGGQTDLAGFTVRAGALPAGVTVGYPGDRSASTPDGGTSLLGGSTDHVAVRFTTTGVPPGRYSVPLTISYTAATSTTTTGTVTLVVS